MTYTVYCVNFSQRVDVGRGPRENPLHGHRHWITEEGNIDIWTFILYTAAQINYRRVQSTTLTSPHPVIQCPWLPILSSLE